MKSMAEINADHGTVLPKGASALVVGGDGELSFMMSDGADDQETPQMVQLLVAVLIKSRDPEWFKDMISAFVDAKTN